MRDGQVRSASLCKKDTRSCKLTSTLRSVLHKADLTCSGLVMSKGPGILEKPA